MAIKIETAVWEQLPGKGEVKLYTLSNDSGMKVTVSSLGAVIVSPPLQAGVGGYNDLVHLALQPFHQLLQPDIPGADTQHAACPGGTGGAVVNGLC